MGKQANPCEPARTQPSSIQRSRTMRSLRAAPATCSLSSSTATWPDPRCWFCCFPSTCGSAAAERVRAQRGKVCIGKSKTCRAGLLPLRIQAGLCVPPRGVPPPIPFHPVSSFASFSSSPPPFELGALSSTIKLRPYPSLSTINMPGYGRFPVVRESS